jgi:hypothetical protein
VAKQIDCLKSTVRNISGETLTFSFLPTHGVTLEADEELDMFGSVADAIARASESPGEAQLRLIAFQNALQDGVLEIVKEPNPILNDGDTSKMIGFTAPATLAAVQMCTQLDGGDDAADDVWV